LNVKDLRTYFYTAGGTVKATDGVSFDVKEGTTFGLAGESGCGKTTVAMSILNLIPHLLKVDSNQSKYVASSRGEIVGGQIWYKGKDLLKLSQEEMRQIRGKEIAMIFQNPIPALNPIETIGFQMGEAVTAHDQTRRERLRQLVIDYLGKVELKDAKKRYKHDPHMFSGGEGQRIMVAMALISGPSFLIADEPTKSLDVIVQRQILTLLREMKKQFNLSMLLITHDLAIIAELSDYVAIMYAGKIMEHSDVVSIYKHPKHPYTQGLLASVPRLYGKKGFRGLPGEPPNPLIEISGCKFHLRCPHAIEACSREEPPLVEVKPGHLAACIRINQIPEWQN
jgi:oligopeptide/dipeptide ABC transporter ATP-binding protein